MTPATAGTPSRTAAMVAAYRAHATRSGDGLCNDPWASALVGDSGATVVEAFNRLVPSMERLVAVRTAFVDAQVRYWTSGHVMSHMPPFDKRPRPIDQAVIVGAGLDSRGARLRRPGLMYFEIDHPKSVQYKQDLVRGLRDYPADGIAYVGCDLEEHDLVGMLSSTTFQVDQPAVFVCEGLVEYLSEAAVTRMLAGIAASCHVGSVIVLDHVTATQRPDRPISNREQLIRQELESLGEPLRFEQGNVLRLLDDTGFRCTHSTCLADIHESMTGQSDSTSALRFQHVTIASRRTFTDE